jgi:competence transcription factor ComK
MLLPWSVSQLDYFPLISQFSRTYFPTINDSSRKCFWLKLRYIIQLGFDWLIDWFSTPTLAIFQLYRSFNQKHFRDESFIVGKYVRENRESEKIVKIDKLIMFNISIRLDIFLYISRFTENCHDLNIFT